MLYSTLVIGMATQLYFHCWILLKHRKQMMQLLVRLWQYFTLVGIEIDSPKCDNSPRNRNGINHDS